MEFAAGLIIGFIAGAIATVELALCAADKREEDDGVKKGRDTDGDDGK